MEQVEGKSEWFGLGLAFAATCRVMVTLSSARLVCV
jgi:hypothetical protein